MLKIDMHVHSFYSNSPAGFLSAKFGINESYTSPFELYHTLKSRGMDFVTITDHNNIEGALRLKEKYPEDTFISEEVTTYFPEDENKVHVLVYDIDEETHKEIQKIRKNIYELVRFLKEKGILFAIAHPLYDMSGLLDVHHIEKFVLLFDVWEIQNGSRSRLSYIISQEIAKFYTWDKVLRLADKHGFLERSKREISFIGGSDDHSGLDAGKTYTKFYLDNSRERISFQDIKKAVLEGKCIPSGLYGSPVRLAHNVMKIVYSGLSQKTSLGGFGELLSAIFDNSNGSNGSSQSLKHKFFSKITYFPFEIVKKKKINKFFEEFLNLNFNEISRDSVHYKSYFIFNLFLPQVIKRLIAGEATIENISSSLGFALLTGIPYSIYVATYYHRALEKHFVKKIAREILKSERISGKTICFTDTFFEINGVARTYQNILKLVNKYQIKEMKIALCEKIVNKEFRKSPYVKIFKPVFSFPLPEYPEMKLNFPNFLQLLSYIEKKNFEVIYAATPGVLGFMALFISKILKLPFVTTFHTHLAEYVYKFTGDYIARDITWSILVWFYNQANRVLVPSRFCKELLVEKGVKGEIIEIFERGVDLKRFNPAYRDPLFFKNFIPGYSGEKVVLYVGRVSKEKEIDVFLEVAEHFAEKNFDIKFIIVGDGPYRKEAEARRIPNVYFTGYLEGKELSTAYASSWLFLFPSTTETFGNVILEACASGLPVLVSDKGASKENVIHGETGFIVKNNDVKRYVHYIKKLFEQEELYQKMRNKALSFVKEKEYEKLLLDVIKKISLDRIDPWKLKEGEKAQEILERVQ